MSYIDFERHDAVASVRLNRPEKLNSLTGEMILTLSDLFRGFASDASLRAVILTGAGEKAFCVGTDISELAGRDETEALNISKRGQTLCDLIELCPVPVIAAINGLAVGGGCELALACHIRLATENTRFSLPETKLGIIPGYGGTQRMSREVGTSRALEIMLGGREVSAADAARLGLINRVVGTANLLPEAKSLAQDIAKLAPLAIRACLESVRVGLELPLDEGLAVESRLFAELFATTDMREGTSAFLEKRAPVFKGE
jgi:enoyl-CoA hydratase